MWTCPTCKRIFGKTGQPHSCKKIPLEQHFKNKEKTRELFDFLVKQINRYVGKCKIISLPCCIHLFGEYDFIAALPKKEKLEIRFAADHKINDHRVKQCVPVYVKVFKICLEVCSKKEIDSKLIGWLKKSYHPSKR